MSHDEFFQRHAFAEAQRLRAQAADGPRCYFEHPRALVIEAKFGVDGTVLESKGSYGRLRTIENCLLIAWR